MHSHDIEGQFEPGDHRRGGELLGKDGASFPAKPGMSSFLTSLSPIGCGPD